MLVWISWRGSLYTLWDLEKGSWWYLPCLQDPQNSKDETNLFMFKLCKTTFNIEEEGWPSFACHKLALEWAASLTLNTAGLHLLTLLQPEAKKLARLLQTSKGDSDTNTDKGP